MKLRHIEAAVDPNDPFKDDSLERKPFAEKFARFLSQIEGSLTISLVGEYGSGKTHFLQRLASVLESLGVPTVSFNAWETDFAAEPLTPILSELSESFAGRLPKRDQVLKKTKALGGRVAAVGIPLLLKVVTAGILEASDFADASAFAEAAEKVAKSQLARFAAAKKTIHSFKAQMQRLSDEIRSLVPASQGQNADFQPPIVVLVDELDRCRPSYAIELLEVLKHLLDIRGIVFLIAIDPIQLASAAQAVFGPGLKVDGYLRRFLDLEVSLPTPNIRNFCLHVMQQEGSLIDWRSQLFWVELAKLCQGANFSLRKTRQFLTRAAIAIKSSDALADPEDIALLVFLRDYSSDLYVRFRDKKATSWDILTELRTLDPEFGYPRGNVVYFIQLFAAVDHSKSNDPFLARLREDYAKRGIDFELDGPASYSMSLGDFKRLIRCVDFCAAFH